MIHDEIFAVSSKGTLSLSSHSGAITIEDSTASVTIESAFEQPKAVLNNRPRKN